MQSPSFGLLKTTKMVIAPLKATIIQNREISTKERRIAETRDEKTPPYLQGKGAKAQH